MKAESAAICPLGSLRGAYTSLIIPRVPVTNARNAVSFPAVQFHLSVEGNVPRFANERTKKKKKIIFHGAAALLRNHPLLLFFLFASQLLTQPSIKEKKKKKTNCTDSTMASVCRDLHQVSVRYESNSAQSTVRYRVQVRVTDLRMA